MTAVVQRCGDEARRRLVRRAIAAVLLLLLTPSAAVGAAPWSAPLGIGSPAFGVESPAVAFDASGGALLAWSTWPGSVIGPTTAATGHLAAWPPGGVPRERAALDAIAAPPQAVGDGRFVVLRERLLRPTRDQRRRVRLGVSIATLAGRLGPVREVGRFVTANAQAIAVSRRGAIAVAWVETHGRFRDRYRLRLRVGQVGGRFGPPRALGDLGAIEHPGITSVALAWGRGGELVVAYPRTRPIRGRSVRAVEVLAGRPDRRLRRHALGPREGITDVEAAASPSGRVVVAWGSQDGGEEPNRPFVVRAAIREPGRRRFTAARILDPGGGIQERPVGRLAVALAGDGTGYAAWSAVRSGRRPFTHPVLAATAPPGAPFGAPEQLDTDGAVGGLAARADGRAFVTWTLQPLGRRVLAALREPGAMRFAAAEEVAPADAASAPSPAFSPRTGEPVVVWVDRPGFQVPASAGTLAPAVLYAAARAP